MDKNKAIKQIFLFAGVVLALVLIIGARHIGLKGISDLLNPLRSFNSNRAIVVAAGIQPMVIWKKIEETGLFRPKPPLTPPSAVTETDTKSTPETVIIEAKTENPVVPSKEPQVVAAVTPEYNVPKMQQTASVQEIAVPVAPPPPLPYSLQLCSCRAVESAQHSLAGFKKKGLDVYLVKVTLYGDGGTWWRVYTGQYATLDETLAAKKDLGLSDAIAKKTPFANLIGEYTSGDQTRAEQERLTVLGLFPYVLEDTDNVFRLFVGAYTRKTQAEQQALELESMGLISQAVAR